MNLASAVAQYLINEILFNQEILNVTVKNCKNSVASLFRVISIQIGALFEIPS